jgi:hypothetical protein
MMAHLDALDLPYHSHTPGVTREREASYSRCAYSNGYSTYIHALDGNMLELVHHPLGVQDSAGDKVERPMPPRARHGLGCPATACPYAAVAHGAQS